MHRPSAIFRRNREFHIEMSGVAFRQFCHVEDNEEINGSEQRIEERLSADFCSEPQISFEEGGDE